VTLSEAADLALEKGTDLEALDDALAGLQALDPLKATIVELRFFAGLTSEEIAGQLGVSPETVARHWRRAKTWLYDQLREPGGAEVERALFRDAPEPAVAPAPAPRRSPDLAAQIAPSSPPPTSAASSMVPGIRQGQICPVEQVEVVGWGGGHGDRRPTSGRSA